MSVVEMSKIKLSGLSYQKDAILNALHKTGSVELRTAAQLDGTGVFSVDGESEAREKLDGIKSAVDFIVLERNKIGKKSDDGNFFVSYKEFSSVSHKEEDLFAVIKKTEELKEKRSFIQTETVRLQSLKNQYVPYADLKNPFSDYKNTQKTTVKLGIVKNENVRKIKEAIDGMEYVHFSVECAGSESVVLLVALNETFDSAMQVLNENGFNECPFRENDLACDQIAKIDEQIKSLGFSDDEITQAAANYADKLRDLKILYDHYKFELEKLLATEKFRCTQTSFVLEGYFPKEREEEVKSAIENVTDCVFYEISAPTKNDNPPTLLKNGSVVKQAEFITDMYSAPDYREMDPSKFVLFFFMLFMGVIMADIGYGVLMTIIGLLLARKQKVDNGSKRLWNVVAIGGVFSAIFGIVFNSFFGFSFLPFTLLISPVPSNGMDNLKMILVLCLFLGVLHISAGYVCKAINAFMHKDILGGIFDGLIWVVFFIGFVFGTFNLIAGTLLSADYIENMNPTVKTLFDTMETPGLYIALVSLAIAAITAGRNEKGVGKLTKGFGAVYGLINLMSDILSYARIFGLMLSGMIIANTFNDIAMQLMTGPLGYVMGAIVLVLGHSFNLAMGVLGAYIHDSRLQYIEFFGKFYTGEGEKFTPLGSKFEYIYLTK